MTVLFATLACNTATSLLLTDASTSPSNSAEDVQLACPAVLSSIVDAATTVESFQLPEEEHRLVTFFVQGNELSNPLYEAVPSDLQDEQADVATQRAIGDYFTTLVPEQSREFLTEFSVLTDGKSNLLAAVAQSDQDPAHWRLEVDIVDAQDYENLTFTLIHEFGHLLTLNEGQVSPSAAVFNDPHNADVRTHEAAMCTNFFARGAAAAMTLISTSSINGSGPINTMNGIRWIRSMTTISIT